MYILTVKDWLHKMDRSVPCQTCNGERSNHHPGERNLLPVGTTRCHPQRPRHTIYKQPVEGSSPRIGGNANIHASIQSKVKPSGENHRDLGAILRALLEGVDQRKWEEYLPQAPYAIRTSVCEATGLAPHRMVFGRDASEPLDNIFGAPPAIAKGGLPHIDYAAELRKRIDVAHRYARENLTETVRRRRRQYIKEKYFVTVGTAVWLFTPKTKTGDSRKLTSYWTGPGTIEEKMDELLHRILPDPKMAKRKGISSRLY